MDRWVWGIPGRILPLLLLWSGLSAPGHAATGALIFPEAREVEGRNERFPLDPSVSILVPPRAHSWLPRVRRDLSAVPFPSDADPVVPLNMETALQTASVQGVNLEVMKSGRVEAGKLVFELGRQGGKPAVALATAGAESAAIPIGEDASSILFLHASAKPARNVNADDYTWNYADMADLLGWYVVTYEDGFVENVPLRYGVNILEAGWGINHTPSALAYAASLVDCSESGRERLTLFAYEWVNPRRGMRVKEVRLKTSSGFKNADGQVSPENPLLLAAVSLVKNRTPPEPKPLRAGDK